MPAFCPIFLMIGFMLVPVMLFQKLFARDISDKLFPGKPKAFYAVLVAVCAFWGGLVAGLLICAYALQPREYEFAFGGYSPLGLILTGAAGWGIGIPLSTALHELGHWVPAKIFGAWTPIFSVGPQGAKYLVLGNWFGTQFRVSAFNWSGFVCAPEFVGDEIPTTAEEDAEMLSAIEKETGASAPATRSFSLKQRLWFTGGGLIVTAFLTLVCGLGALFMHGEISAYLGFLWFWNALLLFWNVIPWQGSDGWFLQQLLKKPATNSQSA